MSDYFEITATIVPFSEDASDLLAAFLAEEGYETFMPFDYGLKAYVPSSLYNKSRLKEIFADFPMEVALGYEAVKIPNRDWNEEWEKNYFQPIVIDDQCVIHSSFHKDFPQTIYDIVIDPKMAFGTGHHATTSMMVRYLLEENLNGKSVIDMGTGTGILAILACLKGARKIAAIEIDPGACENAEDNFKTNKVVVELINGDSSALENCENCDLFLANINRNIILADMERYVKKLKPGGKIIFSGFFEKDIPMIKKNAERFGLKFESQKNDGEWASVYFIV